MTSISRFGLGSFAGCFIVISALSTRAADPGTVEGTLQVWHPMSLTFHGPEASETDDDPNPFLDYRLQVQFFAPDSRVFDVPGFFDGDGQGGAHGNVWRVRFTPDQARGWSYKATFRQGPAVAIDPNPEAGSPTAFDGAAGEFRVAERDPDAPGFLKWGRLAYVGKHYLKFKDGPYWIKGATNEPENLLAYEGFDSTVPSHHFAAHIEDWQPGDPDWGNGKGRGIIGALNYLSSRHVNSIYFLTMNIGGDGKDVWPWAGWPDPEGSADNDNLHYDINKLAQWNTVFEHAQRKGIALHFVFNEAEKPNKLELDNGELGPERKLYYRELIARFGHNPALQWNLCEEYNLDFDFGQDRVRQFARYVRDVDPYDHPITVHSSGDPVRDLAFTFGDPLFETTSIQLNQRRIDLITEAIREATSKAGRPLPASLDEFTIDVGTNKSHIPVDNAELYRKEKLWPTYLSGGNIEFILEGLLSVDTFKTKERETLWNNVWYARRFLEDLPFWKMRPDDNLLRGSATISVGISNGKKSPMGGQVFTLPKQIYAIYLPDSSSSGELNLTGVTGDLTQRWYNPRTGEYEGETKKIQGGAWVQLGQPLSDPKEDWVVLVQVEK